MVGLSLTAFTVRVNDVLAVRLPSLTVTVIVAVPYWLSAGSTVTVRFASLPPVMICSASLGTSSGSSETAEIVQVLTSVSTSLIVKPIAPVETSSSVARSAIALIVGASLTGVTVNVKVLVVMPFSESVMVRVIVTSPLRFSSGSNTRVRFAPLPPSVIFDFSSSAVLLVEYAMLKLSGPSSTSASVNSYV